MLHVVITTIQQPTSCVYCLAERLNSIQARLVVAGDKKGPESYTLSRSRFPDLQVEFLPLDAQLESSFTLGKMLPVGHYARKNIGYLSAIQNGASCIYETDDDNKPNDFWTERTEYLPEVRICDPGHRGWVNVYSYFKEAKIWPRGLPLDEIRSRVPEVRITGREVRSPVQQGLVDGSPDVDAIWRLVLDAEFEFERNESVLLPPGNWCPFNTQSTWWWPLAYPLLYIPSYCSFRMCDIWKSFIAQRCLWALDLGVTFHAPEVIQDRNIHDLSKDFADEVPGYLNNKKICNLLDELSLSDRGEHVADNLHKCYSSLIDVGIFPPEELRLLESWIQDLEK